MASQPPHQPLIHRPDDAKEQASPHIIHVAPHDGSTSQMEDTQSQSEYHSHRAETKIYKP